MQRKDRSYRRFGVPVNWDVADFEIPNGSGGAVVVYDLQGRKCARPDSLAPGIYVTKQGDNVRTTLIAR